MTGRPLTQDIRDKISKMSHLPRSVIAKRLGIGYSTVYKHLNHPKKCERKIVTDQDVSKWVTMYRNHWSPNKIAKFVGFSRSTVQKHLSQIITMRTAVGAPFQHGLARGYLKMKGKFVHRTVAEQVLHRPLTKKEVVHHCNGIRNDNRPENLWVFPDNGKHTRFHRSGFIHNETIKLKDYL